MIDHKAAALQEPERNVFFLNAQDEIIWQIDPSVISHDAIGCSDVYLDPDGELMGYGSNGIEYMIDLESGHILDKELIR